MPAAVRRRDAAKHTIVLLLVAVLGVLAPGPPVAAHQDRAELSRVQRNLDAVRRLLADTRADADRVAAALVQADRDVTQARAALRVATATYRAAQATRARAVLEAARAKLEVDAQQAVIDRRARATYINNAPSAMLTLLVDADGVGELLDRSKLLDNVAKAANNELAALVDARIQAQAARQLAVAAEQHARVQQARMRERGHGAGAGPRRPRRRQAGAGTQGRPPPGPPGCPAGRLGPDHPHHPRRGGRPPACRRGRPPGRQPRPSFRADGARRRSRYWWRP